MKLLIIPSLLCLFAVTTYSQGNTPSALDWSPEIYQVGKKYPGYVIQLNGDTLIGFIKADNRCATAGIGSSNQNMVEFYLNETDKKPTSKYKPDDIKGYKVADKLYESIAYSGGLLKKANFNVVVEDGAIRQYEWYETVDNFTMMTKGSNEEWKDYDTRRFVTKSIVAKGGKDPIEFGMLGLQFAKKMPDLISDNAEMAAKVTNKEKGYKALNILEVIAEYNAWAAAQ